MRRVRQGWWWFLDYLYAVRQQLLGLVRRRPPAAFAHGRGDWPVVLLLPGVYENWLFLRPAARRLNALGYRIHAVPSLGNNARDVPSSALLVAAELRRLRSELGVTRVILLAHSKGGLIGKHVMLDAAGAVGEGPDDSAAVELLGLVAIATPFAGSRYARYLPPRTLRLFSPTDAVLVSLQGQTSLNARVMSLFPDFDPHIPDGSYLSGAANERLPLAGHFRILGHDVLLTAVERSVAELRQAPGTVRAAGSTPTG